MSFLTLLAEKSNDKIAGIIISFPSTIAIGYFFLGYFGSTEAVKLAAPGSLIPLGITLIFTALYSYLAHWTDSKVANKYISICLSLGISLGAWFFLSLFAISFEIQNLFLTSIIFFSLGIISYIILAQQNSVECIHHSYSKYQQIGRSLFIGFIIAVIMLLSKTSSPFFTSIFIMFPAATSSMLIIIHWYYGAEKISAIFKKAPIGTLSIYVYIVTCMYSFPEYGAFIGSLIAYSASLISSLSLSYLLNHVTSLPQTLKA